MVSKSFGFNMSDSGESKPRKNILVENPPQPPEAALSREIIKGMEEPPKKDVRELKKGN